MAPLKFVKQVIASFSQDKVGQLSAAFAYVATFSIGPLILVVISIVGLIFGQKAVEGTLFNQLSGTLGESTAKTLQTVVAHTHKSGSGTIALVGGIIGLLLGATGITSQIQNSFNTIFGIVPDPKGGLKRTVYVKVKNILLVLIGGFAVMASLITSTVIVGFAKKLTAHTGIPPIVLELLNELVSLIIFIVILYFVYKILPDIRLPRKIVLWTSVVVSLLFTIGKLILGVIIGKNGTASAYGAAASLVTLLLWIFYSGQILFIGAEGIKIYGQNAGLVYKPKKFNLKRTTLVIDSKGEKAKFVEAFIRGLRKTKK